jgi:hypothetical protein
VTGQSDVELAALRAALEAKEQALAQVEQELADLRGELDAFAREYNARVGARQARLEALEAEVAELRRRRAVPGHREIFADGYASVDEQFRRAWTRPPETEPAPAAPAPPPVLDAAGQGELKRLYRELARAHHPDFATTDDERARRTRVMVEINAAYADRRLADLRAVAGLASAAPREPDLSPAARLAWLRAELARVNDVLIAREREQRELEQGTLMQLKVEAALARRRGRDVLAEALSLVERRIAERELELAMLRGAPDSPGRSGA